MCIIWSTSTWMQCWPQYLVYLQTRSSEEAIVAYVRFLGGSKLCSISVGVLEFGRVILDCSFERRTEDAHSTNCHGGPGRQTAVANSIKGNTPPTAVSAFKPRRGNLRKYPFSCFSVLTHSSNPFGFFYFWNSSYVGVDWKERCPTLCSLLIKDRVSETEFDTNSHLQHRLVKSK